MITTSAGNVSVADYENLVAEGRKLMQRVSQVRVKQASWNDDLTHFHLVEEKQKAYMRVLSSEVESGVVESMTNPAFVEWFSQYQAARAGELRHDDKEGNNTAGAGRVWHALPWFHQPELTACTDFAAMVPFPRQLTQAGEVLVTDAVDELQLPTFCVHTVSVRAPLAGLARAFLASPVWPASVSAAAPAAADDDADVNALGYTGVPCHTGKDVLQLCAQHSALRDALTHTPCLFLTQHRIATAQLCLRALVIHHRCVAMEGVMDSTVRSFFDTATPAWSPGARLALMQCVQAFVTHRIAPHMSTSNRDKVKQNHEGTSEFAVRAGDGCATDGHDESTRDSSATHPSLYARSYNVLLRVCVNTTALRDALTDRLANREPFVPRVLNIDPADVTCFEMFTPDELTVISHVVTSRRDAGHELDTTLTHREAEQTPELRLWGCPDTKRRECGNSSRLCEAHSQHVGGVERGPCDEVRAVAADVSPAFVATTTHEDECIHEHTSGSAAAVQRPTSTGQPTSDQASGQGGEMRCCAGGELLTSQLASTATFTKTAAVVALTVAIMSGASRVFSLFRQNK